MSRWLSWIFIVPVGLVIIDFSVSNRGMVAINLWPLDVSSLSLPIFVVVLASIFVGVLLASVVAWLTAGKLRSRIRTLARRAELAEQEITRLHDAMDDLKSAQKDQQIVLAPRSDTRAA